MKYIFYYPTIRKRSRRKINTKKTTIMKGLRTPSQEYAHQIIEKIDSNDYAAVVELVMTRPMTLRNAMNQYLYKSFTKQINQRKKYRV